MQHPFFRAICGLNLAIYNVWDGHKQRQVNKVNIKRQRGRGRNKPTNNNPNRAYESTGPDIKVRGSAQTILEKYQQVGRDAMASGDRILAENYMQHAEH